ncbi:hypothetical protein IEZ26_18270 [Nocardioides cavernae]|uniref:PE-PGRS family protein n=1 Tax=Nocardioides cavernae TaxID=1921566 RepID=A0ABR8NFC8_9ACTN|nr:hypothetical protein [Nocardioides cavernae]MBD3926575.1 hypothetical protein [Nocardioides cavernae]MBM7512294.1 hypothetical protein [Nocardioides cavernae]
MAPDPADPSWLPDRQLAVALAHADALADTMCHILYDYLQPGPLSFETVADGDLAHVKVRHIAPLPPAVSRYAADVLTQLRAAVEHAVYAEVEFALGRELTPEEAGRVEMPAATSAKSFTDWLNGRRRKQLAPLRDGSELVRRIRALQPYHRRDTDEHPLRVLAQHTNLTKHRTPAVAAVRLGRVNTWPLNDPDIVVGADGAPLRVGTVLATGPLHKRVPLDIWPTVAIQRPHTGEWKVIAKELGTLSEWVRTVAIPVLVTGDAGMEPRLPARIDLTRGWGDPREAVSAGDPVQADERFVIRIQARHGRGSLVEILLLHPEATSATTIRDWVGGLRDEEVIAHLDALGRAAKRGPIEAGDACLEVIRLAEGSGQPPRG